MPWHATAAAICTWAPNPLGGAGFTLTEFTPDGSQSTIASFAAINAMDMHHPRALYPRPARYRRRRAAGCGVAAARKVATPSSSCSPHRSASSASWFICSAVGRRLDDRQLRSVAVQPAPHPLPPASDVLADAGGTIRFRSETPRLPIHTVWPKSGDGTAVHRQGPKAPAGRGSSHHDVEPSVRPLGGQPPRRSRGAFRIASTFVFQGRGDGAEKRLRRGHPAGAKAPQLR